MTSPKQVCPVCGSDIPPDAADGLCLHCLGRLGFAPRPGEDGPDGQLRLGDYELLEEIARGGMGVVYRARQLRLNRMVALKVVLHGPLASPDFVRRFQNEARIVAGLRHPNIVTVFETGEHNGSHFLSLEFVDGQNFSELVRRHPLPARRAAAYAKTIAEAIEYAHQRGVLHRDLKPSNILLDRLDQPRVTDFGLAKLMNQDTGLTTTGQIMGSPNYMSPEQAGGQFSDSTVQSDVYSLGAILYELLTGRPPFQGATLQAVLEQVETVEPVPPQRLNPGIPVDLQTICLKCLQKDPARRYESAQMLADDLGRFLGHQPIWARPVPAIERLWLGCRRRPLLTAMSVALALAVGCGVAGIFWQWRAAESHAQGEMRQRLIAEREVEETRLNLYAADVAVASQLIQAGNFGRARLTLERLRPNPGEADLRGFEWRYLWNLCRGGQLAVLSGHARTVTCAAFSPAGDLLATGSQDGTVKIWNPSSRTLIKSIGVTTNGVWSVGFTPDGKKLLTGYDTGVELWNLDSWAVDRRFPGELAVLSKTGTLLATAESSPFFSEPAGPVRLFDWHTGRLIRQFKSPGRALALSNDGHLLAIAGQFDGIELHDTSNGDLLRAWATTNAVWSLNFSPDDSQLLSAGWSSNVTVWPVDGRLPPSVLIAGDLHVWSAVYDHDGTTLATTGSDQTVRLWDGLTLQPKSILHGQGGEVWCAAFSPDGKILASGGKDRNVLLWPLTLSPSPDVLRHDSDYRPLFSPDGKKLVTVDPLTGFSMLWKADDKIILNARLANGGHVIGFSPDGQWVTTFDSDHWTLNFWPPTGTSSPSAIPLEHPGNPGSSFAFMGMSPEQTSFFAIDATGLIYVWNVETGKLLHTMTGPAPRIRNAILSPNGKFLVVSVERENFPHLYDCATGAERDLIGHGDFVSGLDFSPDGSTIATGSMDGTIRLWNATNGNPVATLPGHMQETTDVAFSPDGRTLASLGRDESVKLWHLPTLREVVSENVPAAGSWLRFSPDGQKLAVETDKDTLRLWAAPAE